MFHVVCVVRMVFTCSGFLRSVIFEICLRNLVREVIVASALPFRCMSIAKFTRSWVVSGLYAGLVEKLALVTEPAKTSSNPLDQTCKP